MTIIQDSLRWTHCSSTVDDFVFTETRLIDDGELDAWWELFHEHARYWVPGLFPSDLPTVSLIDDTKHHLRERINRLHAGKAASQSPPTVTVHVASPPMMRSADNDSGDVDCRSNQSIYYARGERTGVFPAQVRYVLRPDDSGLSIMLKQVLLLTRLMPTPDLGFLL